MVDERVHTARPAGTGPEFLESIVWSNVPVLLLGATGTGRDSWVKHILMCQNAIPELTVVDWNFKDTVEFLQKKHFAYAHEMPRWAVIKLDSVPFHEQNTLLTLAENLPDNCNLILIASNDTISQTLKSRCFVVNLQPPTFNETVSILCQQRIRRRDAEELAELRPGRPGLALALSEYLPYRDHFRGVINAVKDKDYNALTAALMECPDGTRMWFREWLVSSMAQRPYTHARLAKQCSRALLEKSLEYLDEVPTTRLAVKAAATLLIARN